MEFWLLVWIFYVVLVAFTFAFVSYLIIKSDIKDSYSVPIMIVTTVLLSVFWPGTLLAVLCANGEKHPKEDEENGDY